MKALDSPGIEEEARPILPGAWAEDGLCRGGGA
jgi:hypothetical protein